MADNKPSGSDLLRTLINLLADQEGVKIDFELEGHECEKEKQKTAS